MCREREARHPAAPQGNLVHQPRFGKSSGHHANTTRPAATLPWACGQCGCSEHGGRSAPSVGSVRGAFGNRSSPQRSDSARNLLSFR